MVTVMLAPGASENGLALMLSGLLTQNLADKPHKKKDFDALRAVIAIVAEDVGVALTLEFLGGSLVVHDGIHGVPDVTVRASADDVTNMSLVELTKRGFPDGSGEVSKQIDAAMSSGRIRAIGAARHPLTMLRLTRVMSVHG